MKIRSFIGVEMTYNDIWSIVKIFTKEQRDKITISDVVRIITLVRYENVNTDEDKPVELNAQIDIDGIKRTTEKEMEIKVINEKYTNG